VLGNIHAGNWAAFPKFDFGVTPYLWAMVRMDVGENWVGTVELRLDAPDGAMLAIVPLMPTSGGICEYYSPLANVIGVHDLYLVFPNQAPGELLSLTLSMYGGAMPEDATQTNERMAWWREARFGQFIHWGAYSQLGGSYLGVSTPGLGEWIMNDFQIPRPDYEATAAGMFNPTQFNAETWASLCVAAGQKYMVITSKHHEGFGLFDTKVTGFMDTLGQRYFTLPDFGVYQGFPLRDLSVACREHGVRFGVYYSILDWHHADQLDWGNTILPAGKIAYVQDMKDQLVELMQQCDLDILWFDVGDVKEPCAPATTNFVHLRGRGGADGLTKFQAKAE
jgi:hypothetical protein